MDSSQLICIGKYEQAITVARREISARDYNIDFNCGAPHYMGQALLCLGRYDQAWEHFQDLIRTTRNTVSLHFVGAGLAKWFANDKDEAFRTWRSALKAHYSVYKGLDVRFMLYYAGAAAKRADEIENAIKEIKKRMNPCSGLITRNVAQFLLGDIEERDLYSAPSDYTTTGVQSADEKQLIAYYIGLRALNEGRRRKFLQMMRKATGFDCIDSEYEMIVARRELRLI